MADFSVGLDGLVDKASSPILEKQHMCSNLGTRSLVVIYRNYKEALLRHKGLKNISKEDIDKYLHPIRVYEKHPRKKTIIQYEDLIMLNPIKTIKSVVDFLDVDLPKDRWGKFVQDYESIRQSSVRSYSLGKGKPKSESKGLSLTHHCDKITEKQRLDLDRRMINESGKTLFDRYLQGYLDQSWVR